MIIANTVTTLCYDIIFTRLYNIGGIMKKLAAVFIIGLILSLTTIHSLASASVNLSKPQAGPGGSITISGTAQPNSKTIVKITNETGDILFFEAPETDASGRYSIVFTVPDDIAANTLTVTAGNGSDTATALLAILYPAVPTIPSLGQTPGYSQVQTPGPSPTVSQIIEEMPAAGVSPTFLWAVIGGAFLLTIILVLIVLYTKRKRR